MTDLGRVISQHRGRPLSRLGGVFAAGAMTVGMVWAMFAMNPPQRGVCWLITVGFAIVTVALSIVMARDASTRVDAHERGVVYTRAGKTQAIAFDHIREVRIWTVNGKRSALLIALHDGGEARWIAQLTDLDELLAVMGAHVSPARLPQARVVT